MSDPDEYPGPWAYDEETQWVHRYISEGNGIIWCEFKVPPDPDELEWLIESMNEAEDINHPIPGDELWLEFMSNDLCGLCGQTGMINTLGLNTPAGTHCGISRPCICANGRAIKERRNDG